MQWIGFIAGTTNLTLEVHVTNCSRQQGLEIGLYESLDCNTFRRVSECDTDIKENEKRIFTNTVPLVIGQYYYFVMDGSDDDICDWTIRVLDGSTKVAPLEKSPDIVVPGQICQRDTFAITTPGITGATLYNWTINGVTRTGLSTKYAFDKPGKYEICLDAFNVCDQAPQSCKTIEVIPESTGNVAQQLCFGECFQFLGKNYCETGSYPVVLTAANGCDSIVTLDLVVDDRITASTSLNICEGDTLFLGDGALTTEGNHQVVIENQEGCNVYMNVQLRLIKCQIQTKDNSTPVVCNGENSGIIRFEVSYGTPPFTYTGYKIENPSIVFQGIMQQASQPVSIPGVDEGNYIFTILDTYGNSAVLTAFVSQPPLLQVKTATTEYNGYQISCAGASDGTIKYLPSGGVAGYGFLHNFTSSVADSVAGLPSGTYTSIVTDQNGCTAEIRQELRAPDPLKLIPDLTNPDCSGTNSGIIQIKSTTGGVAPYLYSLDGSPASNVLSYQSLIGGNYLLAVNDANGCVSEVPLSLKEVVIPQVEINLPFQYIRLGDSVWLEALVSPSGMTLMWSPEESVACSSCARTQARPVRDTEYTLTATSADGCLRRSQVSVEVQKLRSFVIANVVTPNGDGYNDQIAYFAGKDVLKIENFRLFDRWGNLQVFVPLLPTGRQQIPLSAGNNGSPLIPGVYTWLCDAEYIDGERLTYRGGLTLLK